MSEAKSIPIGTDGLPMSVWQIWLRRLCLVMIVWGAIELVFGFWVVLKKDFIPSDILISFSGFIEVSPEDAWMTLGVTMIVSAVINVALAFLGIRGARNPRKIALFFWIVLLDAVLTAWSLASNISVGTLDPSSMVSGLFIIAVAVCAWQVRKQTGYFDNHP